MKLDAKERATLRMKTLRQYENLAIRVRRAVVKATQEQGTRGYPRVTVDGFELWLAQTEDGPAWYWPHLWGMRLVKLLESARKKGAQV